MFGLILPRSHATKVCPHRMSEAVEQLILAGRARFRCGSKKILRRLRDGGSGDDTSGPERRGRVAESAWIGEPTQTTSSECLFIDRYNIERPHEGIDMQRPANVFKSSPRPFRPRPKPEYAAHFETRRVSEGGTIKWRNHKIFISDPVSVRSTSTTSRSGRSTNVSTNSSE